MNIYVTKEKGKFSWVVGDLDGEKLAESCKKFQYPESALNDAIKVFKNPITWNYDHESMTAESREFI